MQPIASREVTHRQLFGRGDLLSMGGRKALSPPEVSKVTANLLNREYCGQGSPV